MRLAAFVSSHYGASPSLATYAGGVESAGALYHRLSAADAAFEVDWLAGSRDLPETLEARLVAAGPVDSFLLHFSGYLAWRAKHGVGLALDGERGRALPLAQLCALLDRTCREYLVILDAVLVSKDYVPADVADAFSAELARHPQASGILGIQPADTTDTESALVRLLRWGLDTLAGTPPVTARTLYATLEPELELLPDHTSRCGVAASDFAVLLGVPGGFVAETDEASELTPEHAPVEPRAPTWSLPPPAPQPPPPASVVEEVALLERRAADCAARSDWEGLAAAQESLLDHSGGTAAHEIARQLATLCSSRLADPPRAVSALLRVVAVDGGNAAIRFQLGELYAASGQLDLAVEQYLAGLAFDPRAIVGYRRALRALQKGGQLDRAWNAASALAVLDAASPDELALADAHRPLGLQVARATLSEEHWQGLQIRPQRHRTLERILSLVSGPALKHKLEALRRARQLFVPEPSLRQDPKTSTTTIGRSLAWTARLNAVECPELYVYDSEEAKMGPVPAVAATSRVSKAFARGFTLPELTFLWGRTLTYFRPEHYLLVFFPSVDEMATLLLAAAAASDWSTERTRGLPPDTARLAAHLRKHVAPPHLAEIREVTQSLTFEKARSRVERWVTAIDEAANRAGLIACGDVRVACAMTRRFPLRGVTVAEAHRSDLLLYSVSPEYAAIRAHLGVAVTG